MATSTTNLGLTKPAGTDKIRIAQINGNMDILDDKIGAVGNTSLQAQITSQNEAIAKYDPSSATALSDCNSAKETGRYKTVNNTSNTPFTGHFVLDVIRYNNLEISQVARFSYSTRVFVRGSGDNGSTWTSWEELALKSETQKFSFSTIVTDFNSALESGIYAGNSATNSPITGWVIVLTMRLTDNNNYIAQIALQFGNNYMYIRTRENGTWKSWKNVSAS